MKKQPTAINLQDLKKQVQRQTKTTKVEAIRLTRAQVDAIVIRYLTEDHGILQADAGQCDICYDIDFMEATVSITEETTEGKLDYQP